MDGIELEGQLARDSGCNDGAAPSGSAVLEALCVLFKSAVASGGRSAALATAAARLSELLGASGQAVAFQFVGDQVYVGGRLLPLSLEDRRGAMAVAQLLSHNGIHEITFQADVKAGELARVAGELVSGQRQRGKAPQIVVAGVSWRPLDGAAWGTCFEKLDPELFALSKLCDVEREVESLMMTPGERWEFNKGATVVRLAEEGLFAGPLPMVRAMEFRREPWGTARRAAAACIHLLVVGKAAGVAPRSYRAAAHCLLACCAMGYQISGGRPWKEAVEAAYELLVGQGMAPEELPTPHRVRTCTLLHMLHRTVECQGGDERTKIVKLLWLCYDLEKYRVLPETSSALALSDCLAIQGPKAMQDGIGHFYRLLVTSYGQIPPGTTVRLSDGRRGVVLEPNPQAPLNPTLLVDGRAETSNLPVRLLARCVR